MQRKYGIVASAVALSAHAITANAAWTQLTNTQGAPSDLTATITRATDWILGFIALIAVLMIIFGGIQYLTSAGNADTAKKGKDTVTRAVIGLAIAGLAYAVVNLIISVVALQ